MTRQVHETTGSVTTNAQGLTWSKDWLGPAASLYHPDQWQPAAKIEVAAFRQIWIWPLALRVAGNEADDALDKGIDDTKRQLDAAPEWTEIEDLLHHAGPLNDTNAAEVYGEFVYFYDYLQSILFRPRASGKPCEPPFRVWRRTDVDRLVVDLEKSGQFSAKVSRCSLYLFRSGAAILVVEADFGPNPRRADTWKPLTLADAQAFIDRARRAYTPYFIGDTAQGVPSAFVWKNAQGEPINGPSSNSIARPATLQDDITFIETPDTAGLRSAPVAAHWRTLLMPLRIAGYEPPEHAGPVWRHVVDERIPLMTFLSLTSAATCAAKDWSPEQAAGQRADLRAVSRGDWHRLCYADGPGSDPMPFAPGFCESFEAKACYDRYFPSEATTSAVRYLFAGYHFAAVGSGPFFDNTLVKHFRRHYFQMALLAHMELTTLLATSSQISAAVRQLARRGADGRGRLDGGAFRRRLVAIETRFLEFVHLYRFTGLSNQIQPTEMFNLWRSSLGLDTLYQAVREELESATEFHLTTEQTEQTLQTTRLTIIAGAAATVGLAFTFASIPAWPEEATKADGAAGYATLFIRSGLLVAAFAGLAHLVQPWVDSVGAADTSTAMCFSVQF